MAVALAMGVSGASGSELWDYVDAAAAHQNSFWCAVKRKGGHNVHGANQLNHPPRAGNAQGKAKFLAYVNATYACPRDCSGKGQFCVAWASAALQA